MLVTVCYNCSLRIDIIIIAMIIIITTAFSDGGCHDDIEICVSLCRLDISFYLGFDFILIYEKYPINIFLFSVLGVCFLQNKKKRKKKRVLLMLHDFYDMRQHKRSGY